MFHSGNARVAQQHAGVGGHANGQRQADDIERLRRLLLHHEDDEVDEGDDEERAQYDDAPRHDRREVRHQQEEAHRVAETGFRVEHQDQRADGHRYEHDQECDLLHARRRVLSPAREHPQNESPCAEPGEEQVKRDKSIPYHLDHPSNGL